MTAVARLFWSAAAAVCLWRGERLLGAYDKWRNWRIASERKARP